MISRVRLICANGISPAEFLLVVAFQTAPEAGIVRLQLQGSFGIGDGQIQTVLFGIDQRQVAQRNVVIWPEFDGLHVGTLGLRIAGQFVVAQAKVVQEQAGFGDGGKIYIYLMPRKARLVVPGALYHVMNRYLPLY